MIGVELGVVSRCYNSHVWLATLHSYPTRNNRAYISDDVNNAVRGLEIIKSVDLSLVGGAVT